MNKITCLFRSLPTTLISGASLFVAGFSISQAQIQLSFPDVPLYLQTPIRPNVFITLDDSGSMDWEILSRKHWHACRYYSPTVCQTGYSDPDGNNQSGDEARWPDDLWVDDGAYYSLPATSSAVHPQQRFLYFFANSDNTYNHSCTNESSGRGAVRNCANTALAYDWRVQSSDFNVMYYNPGVTYEPWEMQDGGSAMADASFTAARSNPKSGTAGYSTTKNLSGFSYDIWVDDAGYNGAQPSGGNKNAVPNNKVDLWDTHYRVTVNTAGFTIQQYANNAPVGGILTALPAALCGVSGRDPLGCNTTTLAQEQQNIANWYQYARRRSLVAKGAIAAVLSNSPAYRYGLTLLNDYGDLFVEMPAGNTTLDLITHNSDLLENLANHAWESNSTPLRAALKRTGQYFSGGLSVSGSLLPGPIQHECQQNFNLLITDGYWNQSVSGFNDEDGDGVSITLADIAYKYYHNDLASGIANNVQPNEIEPSNYTHQRLVNFTAAFGVSGNLTDTYDAYSVPPGPGSDGWPDNGSQNLLEGDDWGDPISTANCPASASGQCAERIDDLWHAAWNSRGGYLSAATPAELVNGLEQALNEIDNRTNVSHSASAPSQVFITGDGLFLSQFNSQSWTSEIEKRSLTVTPDIDTRTFTVSVAQSADWTTDDPATFGNDTASWWQSRLVLTVKPTTGAGIVMAWPANPNAPASDELDSVQTAALHDNPDTSAVDNDGKGPQRLAYLLGDTSNEGTSGGFRVREKALGDVISATPLYIAESPFRYPDSLESASHLAYRTSTADNRTGMVYFGANDGMLHALDSNGAEQLAYVPSMVFAKLNKLTSPSYSHSFFLDGQLDAGDAYFDNAWHTVLAGGLGYGAKGVFALDITDPANFSAANADSISLWEFTGGAYPGDMGHVFGKVTIAKMANGDWAAIFGNGYNSQNGQAVLFIVRLADGALLKRIPVGIVPVALQNANGLSTPEVIDSFAKRTLADGSTVTVGRQFDHIADYIYAGDLYGNLWKFDVTDSDPANWAAQALPLLIATDATGKPQPITTQPKVRYHPETLYDANGDWVDTGYLVYFGTGRYLQAGDQVVDPVLDPVNALYAVWDKLRPDAVPATRNQLLAQTVTVNELNASGSQKVRITSDHVLDDPSDITDGWLMDLLDSSVTLGYLGWYLDLPVGERVIGDITLRNDRVVFSSFLPSDDPCAVPGETWLMSLDADSGARTYDSTFDLDGDSRFSYEADQIGRRNDNIADFIDHDNNSNTASVPASGLSLHDTFAPSPSLTALGNFLYSTIQRNADVLLLPNDPSSGAGGQKLLYPGYEPLGRQGWLQPE